ncbi:MAG: tetratricopeptide repeat protein [Gammaproteobacteria bacterium]|nr:MAG: tetratricopeptide repeat protein [Gammaproteobacteria bacterium]
MNRIRRRLQHLAFGMVCVLLSATPQVFADDAEELSRHLMQAEMALRQNLYQEAASEYRLAAELSDDPGVAQQATRIAYSYGFNKEALASAKRWAKLDDEDEEALLYVAQLYLRTGEVRKSRRSFEKLLKRGREPADERLLAMIPFLSREDASLSYELMLRLAKPYKDSAEANYAVAVMALQARETKVASERARKASEIEPDWVKPQLLYARAMLQGGDEEGAIDYVSRLVGDDPDPDPEARLELAIMLLSVGRDDDALSQVNQILLEQPSRSDALRLMAIINFRLERLDAARADFQDLLETGHYTMDALYYLGRIADRNSELEQAIRYYSQVTRGSNAIISQRRAAGIMAQMGEEEEALEHLSGFAGINPNFAVDMLQAQAQLLSSIERYPEALEYYDKVVAYRPDSQGAHLGKAELLLLMGRLDDAIDLYRKTVKRWPDSAMALNALGYTLADRTDQYDEAAKLIHKALGLDPESAAIIDSWGWVLHRQGQHDEALMHLERAYERFRDPEVASHIVEVLWALERHDDAETTLENAELLYPDNELLRSVRERLLPDTP